MLNEIEAIFFDWGGTLVGVDRQVRSWIDGAERATRALFAAGTPAPDTAIQDLLDCYDHIRNESQVSKSCRELNFEKVLKVWFKKIKLGRPSPEMVGYLTDEFWQPWTESLDLYEGALNTVATLKARGYRLMLVSNVEAPAAYCEQQFDRLGLTPHFENMVFSSAVGRRKPHKTIYKEALKLLNNNDAAVGLERVLFVGDSPVYDVVAPMEQGLKAVLIRNETSQEQWAEEDYARANPELTISHVNELLDHLPDRSV